MPPLSSYPCYFQVLGVGALIAAAISLTPSHDGANHNAERKAAGSLVVGVAIFTVAIEVGFILLRFLNVGLLNYAIKWFLLLVRLLLDKQNCRHFCSMQGLAVGQTVLRDSWSCFCASLLYCLGDPAKWEVTPRGCSFLLTQACCSYLSKPTFYSYFVDLASLMDFCCVGNPLPNQHFWYSVRGLVS